MIYFLQRQNGDIKIGYTSDYTNRLSALKSEQGNLELLGAESGGFERERELHERFRSLRLNKHREWFAPNDSLMEYILALPPYELLYSEVSKTIKVPRLARAIVKVLQAKQKEDLSLGDSLVQFMLTNHPDIVQIAERAIDLELSDFDPYKQAIEDSEPKPHKRNAS